MSRQKIKLNDFELLYEVMKSLSKMSDGAKLTIDDCGLTVYAKNDFSKCELTSNAVTADEKVEFNIGSLGTLIKVLTTVKELYRDGDYSSDVSLSYEQPFLKIESKKFKTKIGAVEDDRISSFIGNKVHTALTDQMTFTTSSALIKAVNSHSFIFNDSNSARVYITTDPEMQSGSVFARIGNDQLDLADSATLELGLINSGCMDDRKVILDFDRLNILNMVPSDEIKVSIAKERPVIVTKFMKTGKGDTFFNINLYVFLMAR